MIIEWIARALLASLLLTLAALAAERVSSMYGGSRRWVWVGAMIASLALPVLAPWGPGILPRSSAPHPVTLQLPVRPLVQRVTASTGRINPEVSMTTPRVAATAPRPTFIWLAFSLAMLTFVAAAYARLSFIRAHAAHGEFEGTAVRLTVRAGPAAFGFLHPVILVPRWVMDAPAEERRLIVRHEREHIRGGDHWLLAFGVIALIAMPWNLMLWWQHRRLRLAVETDCDARVLAGGADPAMYGYTLIHSIADSRRNTLIALAWGNAASQLRLRILAMTAITPRHRALRTAAALAMCLALALVALDATAASTASVAPVVSPVVTGVRSIASDVSPSDAGVRTPAGSAVVDGTSLTASIATEARAVESPVSVPVAAEALVRVTGVTRHQLRIRITLSAPGARFVWPGDAAVSNVQGDTAAEVTTPVEFRVAGYEGQRIVAHALEAGTVVTIESATPIEFKPVHRASATGPYPMVSFPTTVRVRREEETIPAATQSTDTTRGFADTSMASDTGPLLAPGEVLVRSHSGRPVRVRVSGVGIMPSTAEPGVFDDLDKTFDVVTPAIVRVSPGHEYFLRFDAIDGTDALSVRAAGDTTGNRGFLGLSGSYQGSIVICRLRNGSRIRGAFNEAPTARRC